MKYAHAAWCMFLVWAARKLRLPKRIVWDLEDEASVRRFECALDFEPVEVATVQPATEE